MSKQVLKSIVLLICLFPFGQIYSAFTYDPSLTWKTLHTEHFQIHYHKGTEKLARRTAIIAERVHTEITQYFEWVPKGKTDILVNDRMDFSNGAATPYPRNTMWLYVTPPDDTSVLSEYDDWLELLITHEYTHVVHLDKAWGGSSFLRKIFGRFPSFLMIFSAFPNLQQPLWIIEGLATYKESDNERGIGRGQNSYFKTLMRLEVNSSIKTLRHVNQHYTTDWPMGTINYLYGVYFFNFLRDRYGDEKIRDWIHQNSNNLLALFTVNRRTMKPFGESLLELWPDFEAYLKKQFQPTIDRITKEGATQGEQLTQLGYFTANPRSMPNGDIYYIQNDMLKSSRLMRLRNGQSEPEIVTKVYGSNFDLHPDAGVLLTYLDYDNSTNIFSDIYQVDPNSGSRSQLTQGKRYRYATWGPNGKRIIAVRNEAGQKALHLLSATGEFIETLWQGSDDIVLGQLDWSPNGKTIIAPVWRSETRWNLEQFNIAEKSWKKVTDTGNIETQAIFTADGHNILFCADYGGVFNVYRRNLASGKTVRLTNLIGGAFSVSQLGTGNGIVYLGANPKGFDVYRVKDATTVPDDFTVATAPSRKKTEKPHTGQFNQQKNVDKQDVLVTDYSPYRKMLPAFWLPTILYESGKRIELGVMTYGTDPLNRHQYVLFAGYDLENKWSVGDLSYIYDRWNPSLKVHASRVILAERSEVVGEKDKVQRYRASEALSAELILPFLKRDRQWSLHLGYVFEKEKDEYVAASQSSQPEFSNELVGLAINYNSAKHYSRAISASDGQQAKIVAEDNDAFDNDFSGKIYTVDWRGFFSLTGKHVLVTRLVTGWGTDQPNPFRLGGTQDGYFVATPGQPYSTLTEDDFGKRVYALRGYPEGLLRGRRMGLAEVEYRFPLARIDRGFMAFPLAIRRIYGKVFYNAGTTWKDDYDSSNVAHGAGLEINIEIFFGYHWAFLNLGVGYAHGFDTGGEDQVYLRLGGTF